MDEDRQEILDELQLITAKPVLYLCNVDEGSVKDGNAHVEALKEAVKKQSTNESRRRRRTQEQTLYL